ncbi:MAG: DUF1501 domain-containing protein, partial [Planctomycetales bacterium]|nr:DUF1501 domain-containing protein [Planctomycetales bacterium]
MLDASMFNRRQLLSQMGGGFGMLGLASVLSEDGATGLAQAATETRSASPLGPKPAHFAAKAKRVIFLFMNGGPSHVDT